MANEHEGAEKDSFKEGGYRRKGPLRRLAKELYKKVEEKTNESPRRYTLHPHDIERHSGWEDAGERSEEQEIVPPQKSGTPSMKKFFIIALIFFVVSVAIGAFVLLGGANIISTRNVDIEITSPVSVDAGETFALQIAVENKNAVPLEFTDLVVAFPDGAYMAGDTTEELVRARKSLGTIEPGAVATHTVNAVFFGQEGEEKEVKVTLEYRVKDSNAIFVAEESAEVAIGSSPVRLFVEAQKEVSSGQEVEIRATVASNVNEVTRGLLFSIDYPFGFSFETAEPRPAFGNDTWVIGDLQPGAERSITIRGILEGQDGEEKVFRVASGAPKENDEETLGVAYSTVLHTMTVARPFLSIQTFLDGQPVPEYVAESERGIQVDIFWTNNLPTKVNNVAIEAALSGEVLNESSVSPSGGFYNSANNMVLWDKSTYGRLAEIEPGERGKVSFRMESLPLVKAGGTVFRDPTITLEITARGRRIGEEGVPEAIRSIDRREIKIASDASLTQRALYYGGPFTNTGPLPPEAETETTYTIVWTLVNTANNVSQGTVEARLPSYVRWLGRVSPSGESVRYVAADRSVIWDVGLVRAGAGVSGAPREVAFQVGLSPSVSQIRQAPVLVTEASFAGDDEFTDTIVRAAGRSVTTFLSTDPQFESGMGRVVE